MGHEAHSLQELNLAFQELLCFPEPAALPPAHGGDRLMVWFLLGGKDVGKSTLLHALLGDDAPPRPSEPVEGTQRFHAHLHESAVLELERRLEPLSVELQITPHIGARRRHLCLIDSPDFDSRFERHVSQARRVLASGALDGAVLLASPEKYKNTEYWEAFGRLSDSLCARHILFVLNKADELAGFLDEAREDFTRTVRKRVRTGFSPATDGPDLTDAEVYLINARDRSVDFDRLQERLMRPLTSAEVERAQQENLAHARRTAAERIREHYRLDQVRARLDAASAPERIDDLFDDAFPEPYFQTVAARISTDPRVASALGERIWTPHGGTLAGFSALHAAGRWIGRRNPFRGGRTEPADATAAEPVADLASLTRWGDEGLEQRLAACRRATLAGLLPDAAGCPEPHMKPERDVLETLSARLKDLLARPVARPLSLGVCFALNLPVYLYLVFFLFLLLSPVFLLLRAWQVPHMPDLSAVLTLDNVKVAVLGFAGTYLMAALFTVRKLRDRHRQELAILSRSFAEEFEALLRREVERPPARLAEAFSRLEERLALAALHPVPAGRGDEKQPL